MIDERVEEEHRRMVALAASLGIQDTPARWYMLALALARKHVPELQTAGPAGQPVKWDEFALGALAVEIEREQAAKGGIAIRAAAAALVTREPWKSFLDDRSGSFRDPNRSAALQRQYTNAKEAPFTSIARKAYRYHVETGTLPDWDALVLSIGKK